MPSQNVTIKAADGDYSTLISWEAGEQQNLITATYIHTVTCDPFEDDAVAGVFNLSGWSANASYYVVIQGSNRCGMPWSSTSTFTWRTSYTGANYGFFISTAYTRVYNLQVHLDSAATCYGIALDQANVIIDGLILRADASHATTAYLLACRQSGTNTISNVLVWADPAGMGYFYGITLSAGSPTVNAYNCMAVAAASEAVSFGFNRAVGTMNLYNCVAFNFSTGGRDFNGTITSSYCATDQADGTSGLTGDTVPVFGITNQWTSLSTLDFRFTTFAALTGAGGNYSAVTTVDILGTTRHATDPWAIGVFEPIPSQTVTGVIVSATGATIAPTLRLVLYLAGVIASATAAAIDYLSFEGTQYLPGGSPPTVRGSVLPPATVSLLPWIEEAAQEDPWSDASPQGDTWTDASPQTDPWN